MTWRVTSDRPYRGLRCGEPRRADAGDVGGLGDRRLTGACAGDTTGLGDCLLLDGAGDTAGVGDIPLAGTGVGGEGARCGR